MARKIRDSTPELGRATLSNPDLFGEDVAALAWTGLGAGVSSWTADRFVEPLARSVMPVGDLLGQLVSAGAVAASGLVAGQVVGVVDRGIGRYVRRGGMMLAIAKVVSVALPSYSLRADLAIPFPWTFAPPASQPSLPAGSTPIASSDTGRLLGVASMGI